MSKKYLREGERVQRVGNKHKLPGVAKGGGIDTGKDYSFMFKTRRSSALACCLIGVPYIGISTYLFLSGLAVLGIVLLALPLFLMLVIWTVSRLDA